MENLSAFRKIDFLEQVRVLSEIEEQKKFEAIPELFELHETPVNDKAVESMIIHTLRQLLSQNERETLNGILSNKLKVKKLCINLAGEGHFKLVGPILLKLAMRERNNEILFQILSSLAKIRGPKSLEVFKKFAGHQEPLISALSVEMLGAYRDAASLKFLREIVEESEAEDRRGKCDFITWKALEALAAIGNAEAIAFLVSKIHHENPAARRIIHENLVKAGSDAIPFLSSVYCQEDVDGKILAANILGLIGKEEGADVMVNAMEKGAAGHSNVQYAIYEALGKIASERGIDCLVKGLRIEDDLLLMVVVSSLNARANPDIIKVIIEHIRSDDKQGGSIIHAIAASKAITIFEALYAEDEKIAKGLLESVSGLNDPELISAFRDKLKVLDGPRAKRDAAMLSSLTAGKKGRNILVVDDSNLMLHFYRTAVSQLEVNITTALNGKEAWRLLEKGEEFDLIVTDLNMPVMDGIEFVGKVRSHSASKTIPVIMATTESKKSQMQLAVKTGVNGFIKKPFTRESFRKKIKHFLVC